jgi:Replication-relaxation
MNRTGGNEMINFWVESPELLESQRLMGVMFDLGICTKEHLAKVLDKPLKNITWNIDDIRQKAKKNKENPDDWIKFWKKNKGGVNVFTLGKKGIALVCEILEQEVGNRKPLHGQVAHFVGINDILIRLIDAGRRPYLWYSQKEVSSYLHHKFGIKEFVYGVGGITDVKYKRGRVPLEADGMFQMTKDSRPAFLEYDTGSQVSHIIESKFDRYFQIMPKLPPFSVIFVTKRKGRVETIANAYRTVYREIYEGNLPPYPAYVFVEGTETPFLIGEAEASPIIDISQYEVQQVAVAQEDIQQASADQGRINQLESELADIRKRLAEAESKLNQKVDIENQLIEWYRGLENQSGGLFGKAISNYLKENPFPLLKK